MGPTEDPIDDGSPSGLLRSLSVRVRGFRRSRGWTRQELASRSGLSVRFLARVESGDGNISVVRLERLARALGTSADRLLRPSANGSISLVGLRGVGKSTVGPMLADRIGMPFVEMDSLITAAAGLSLDQIFEIHGEGYYRQLERDAVRHVVELGGSTVVAAAGGVVQEPLTWDLLCERTTVVWLRASPEEHWSRVVAQGDVRPMHDHPRAMDALRSMLREREPSYARAALSVDTSGRDPEEVVEEIQQGLARGDDHEVTP